MNPLILLVFYIVMLYVNAVVVSCKLFRLDIEFTIIDPRVSWGEIDVDVVGVEVALRYGVPIWALMRSEVVLAS
jgi:hypothetical protein